MKAEEAPQKVRKILADFAHAARVVVDQMANKQRTPEALQAAEIFSNECNEMITAGIGEKETKVA